MVLYLKSSNSSWGTIDRLEELSCYASTRTYLLLHAGNEEPVVHVARLEPDTACLREDVRLAARLEVLLGHKEARYVGHTVDEGGGRGGWSRGGRIGLGFTLKGAVLVLHALGGQGIALLGVGGVGHKEDGSHLVDCA